MCFAPPLTDAALARYEELTLALPESRRELRDALATCLHCVKAWDRLPESTLPAASRMDLATIGKTCDVVPLPPEQIEALWDVTPYPRECQPLEDLFNTLPTGRANADGSGDIVDPAAKELRDAAFHLLWHVKEIAHDIEPRTADKLR
ncbi:MAG: hypothetical protein A3E01_10750 [Gammaproteobacteria bacterium RIFCSPHIGHO2_12_FULL_63_22]|nr:MAG: hypothetical protein A3E01_10750 [Gammaproteobacteria bacterium RIFCSPHIGHO2_12_FULL_63_22]